MNFLAEVTHPRYEIFFASTFSVEEFGIKAIVQNEHCDIDTAGYIITSLQTGTSDNIRVLLALT